MRWPWQRSVTVDPKAREALAREEAKLVEQQALQRRVDLVTERLVERRHQNRFAELFEDALRRRQA